MNRFVLKISLYNVHSIKILTAKLSPLTIKEIMLKIKYFCSK